MKISEVVTYGVFIIAFTVIFAYYGILISAVALVLMYVCGYVALSLYANLRNRKGGWETAEEAHGLSIDGTETSK